MDALDFDDYKTELLSGHDLELHLSRKMLFGHDVETSIYNCQFEEFGSQEIDSILSKIGEFQQSNLDSNSQTSVPSVKPRSKSTRDALKRSRAQAQVSSMTKKHKTDDNSTTQALKDVTNVTDKNDTTGVTKDDATRVITKEKPINIPSKASPTIHLSP